MSTPQWGPDRDHQRPMIPAGSSFCNARTKQTASYCERPAGWGTDHVGYGRCKLHGGSTPNHNKELATVDGLPLAVPKSLRAAAEIRKQDPELLSLDGEIAMLRVLEEKIELELGEDDQVSPDDPALQALLALAERIGRLVERSHRIQLERRTLMPTHRVLAFIETMADALRRHVKDEEIIDAVFREIDSLEKL